MEMAVKKTKNWNFLDMSTMVRNCERQPQEVNELARDEDWTVELRPISEASRIRPRRYRISVASLGRPQQRRGIN